ncbi:MAG: SIS domain-containing protein [Clostridia bacterium]|nr:SIS domain-containing protein [Clostridia bacterium]
MATSERRGGEGAAPNLSARRFFEEARRVLKRLEETQLDAIEEAGRALARAIMDGGVIQVFGSGHSAAFAMEMANRAGGLVPVNPLRLEDAIPPDQLDTLRDPSLERDPAMAAKILAAHRIEPADAFIIVSNSGRNGAVVELAAEVKRRGHLLVVVTSLDHTRRVTSRHPSGKKLHEFGDIVIDNCGPYGDALLEVEGLKARVCSISSITGGFIAQGLTAAIAAEMLRHGQEPPVLLSANVDGGDEHNARLFERYQGRIVYAVPKR